MITAAEAITMQKTFASLNRDTFVFDSEYPVPEGELENVYREHIDLMIRVGATSGNRSASFFMAVDSVEEELTRLEKYTVLLKIKEALAICGFRTYVTDEPEGIYIYIFWNTNISISKAPYFKKVAA
jgi:hypothetical protein